MLLTIDEKKKERIAAERVFVEAAIGSQMHRWASAVFRVDATALTDGQVKLVAVFFAVIMGLAGALTGSIMTMIGEWYRIRGVQPVIQTVEGRNAGGCLPLHPCVRRPGRC